jgi:hypothetical protein
MRAASTAPRIAANSSPPRRRRSSNGSLVAGWWRPHPDGVWPESSKYIEEQFEGLPADVVHKITCENAGKFYGLIN